MILNHYGVPLIDTGISYQSGNTVVLDNFDPAALGTGYYETGDFYHYFDQEMVNSMIPITNDLKTKGYVSIHIPMSKIIEKRETILGPVYIIFVILFAFSLLILALFSFSVYRPLKKITVGANEYAAGNLKHNIPVSTDDEMVYIATTLNYISYHLV